MNNDDPFIRYLYSLKHEDTGTLAALRRPAASGLPRAAIARISRASARAPPISSQRLWLLNTQRRKSKAGSITRPTRVGAPLERHGRDTAASATGSKTRPPSIASDRTPLPKARTRRGHPASTSDSVRSLTPNWNGTERANSHTACAGLCVCWSRKIYPSTSSNLPTTCATGVLKATACRTAGPRRFTARPVVLPVKPRNRRSRRAVMANQKNP